MRDRLAASDRVQLHINKGKKKAYIRNGLEWIKRFPVGRSAAFCPGRVKSPSDRPKRTLNGQDDGSKSRDGCGLQPLLGEPGRDRLGQWPDVVGKGVSLDAQRAGVG